MAGRRPVEEAFVARRKAYRLLVTPQRRQPLERIVLHATSLRIPIVEVEGGSLTALAGFDGHQGVALVVEARRFASPDDILARAIERGEPPFVLVLDSLEDPQNVGTLLRSAEAAGVHGVLFPTRRQAPLSPAAVKASAGAVEHLLLAPVDDLAGALADLHIDGLRIVGAEAEAPLTARQADLRGPLALVVGSEGQGLGPTVRRRCDLVVRIPMRGQIGSLNASVAGSILLFEALAQRDPDGTATPARLAPPSGPATLAGSAPGAGAGGAVSPEATEQGRPAKAGKGSAPSTAVRGLATEGAPGATTTTATAGTTETADAIPAAEADETIEAASKPKAKPTTPKAAAKAKTPTAADEPPATRAANAKAAAKAKTPKAAVEPTAAKAPATRKAAGTSKATVRSAPAPATDVAKPVAVKKAPTARRPAARATGSVSTVEVDDAPDDELLPGGPPTT